MTAPFMALHVASHAERLPTILVRTDEWFFSGVRMGMDPKARWPGKGLVASRAHIAVGRLAGKG